MTSGYPQPGDTIGHYRVGQRLGGGGMGVVYEATDLNLERRVALKVIAPDLAEDPEFRERFRREAQAQASLDSRHVVQVYAHGEDDGRLWIASQLVPGGDLRTLLDAQGAPPVTVAVDLVSQVASGLADAHAAGLVHRDIKPANVLLRREPDGSYVAYLADFGIARQVDGELTRTSHATVGTPSYMAPELHTGGRPGPASDVYSLGCLLWATLTGRAPYAGTSEFEVVTKHREEPVPQLEAGTPLNEPLNDVLRRTMAKDPADRPPSAAAVRDRLRALRPTAVPTAAVPAAPPEPSRQRALPAVLGVAAVLLLLAVVGVGWAVTRDGDEPADRSGPTTPVETTSEPSDEEPADGDVETAVANMAEAFASQPAITPEIAECLARGIVDEVGLARLQEIGMLDEDYAFTDVDLAASPDVKAAFSSATFACVTA